MPQAGMVLAVVILKGLTMGLLVAALARSEPWWHQLVLVVVSACLTGIFALIVAVVNARSSRDLRQTLEDNNERIRHVQHKVEADRRVTDETGNNDG